MLSYSGEGAEGLRGFFKNFSYCLPTGSLGKSSQPSRTFEGTVDQVLDQTAEALFVTMNAFIGRNDEGVGRERHWRHVVTGDDSPCNLLILCPSRT